MVDKVQEVSNPATVSISSVSVRSGKFIYVRIVALFNLADRHINF
jgi:hypothetical protein